MQAVGERTEVRWWMLVGLSAVLLGAVLAFNPTLGFVLFGLLCLAGVLAVPASFLIGVALVAALGLRAFVTFGWVPGIVSFADIPLAWLALAVALIHSRTVSPLARRTLVFLVTLLVSIALAWIFNPSEVLRPFLYAALLGEPFAIIVAMLVSPASPRARWGLFAVVMVMLAIQVPIGVYQTLAIGFGDAVQGTLHGAGAGHHVLGGCAALGIIFALGSRQWAKWLAVVALGVLLFLTDARQVFAALVPAILVMRFVSARHFRILSVIAIAAVTIPILLAIPTASDRLNEFRSRQTGKATAFESVTNDLDAATVAIGHGPAETVSRMAFMTTDYYLREDSPLRIFDLHSSEMATNMLTEAVAAGLVDTSVTFPLSSALGVFGDLGIVGLAVLLILILTIVRASMPFGSAIIGAWTLYLILGLVYDWWEQPPFTVLLAVLTGLVLSRTSERQPAMYARQDR